LTGDPSMRVPAFDGADYQPERDHERLAGQLQAIYDLMKDGKHRTLHEIAAAVKAPESSVSAQLRHLRKERFGGHTVNRRHVGNGLYDYQLVVRNV
jgi:hypothetical protein